jgi:spectinomycin phosphotransferase
VRSLPEEFDADALLPGVLEDGWDVALEAAEYAPVGGGSYHWVVDARDGRPYFVTVDDLERKPWLGSTSDTAFDELRRAFDVAAALRVGGLDFVVAPIPTSGGGSVIRIGPRYSVALFPFLPGRAGQFGEYNAAERAAVQTMLAEIHQASGISARRSDLGLPGRRYLKAAFRELDDEWLGGPLSEPARHAFSRNASDVDEALSLAERLAADLPNGGWVVTHGEPHAANLMQRQSGYMLLDWDTVAYAPRERDLWMLVDPAEDEPTIYTAASGRQLDDGALRFFRLSWDLADLAAFTNVLRAPHNRNADTEKAYAGLRYILSTAANHTTR